MKFASSFISSRTLPLLFVASLALLPGRAFSQAKLTATKGAEVSVFGAYLASSSDYGSFIKGGIAAGVDFTVYPGHLPVAPSLEIRIQDASGSEVTEKALLYGLRFQRDINRFHPYFDGLLGGSTVTFHPTPSPDYTAKSTKTYSYGGGVNIDVTQDFAAKLDVQRQAWNLGGNAQRPAGGVYDLNPTTYMVGVTYTIPFDRHASGISKPSRKQKLQ